MSDLGGICKCKLSEFSVEKGNARINGVFFAYNAKIKKAEPRLVNFYTNSEFIIKNIENLNLPEGKIGPNDEQVTLLVQFNNGNINAFESKKNDSLFATLTGSIQSVLVVKEADRSRSSKSKKNYDDDDDDDDRGSSRNSKRSSRRDEDDDDDRSSRSSRKNRNDDDDDDNSKRKSKSNRFEDDDL